MCISSHATYSDLPLTSCCTQRHGSRTILALQIPPKPMTPCVDRPLHTRNPENPDHLSILPAFVCNMRSLTFPTLATFLCMFTIIITLSISGPVTNSTTPALPDNAAELTDLELITAVMGPNDYIPDVYVPRLILLRVFGT